MARSQRSIKLETRTARLKVAQGKRHFVNIGEGLALAYRRTERGYGTWQARYWNGHKYEYSNIGSADDYVDANGVDVLTFYQAQDSARKLAHAAKVDTGKSFRPITVAEAADKYLSWYQDHRRGYKEAENTIRAHILPALGSTRVDQITSAAIRHWLEQLATKPARVRAKKYATKPAFRAAPKTADEKRARKATANRIFAILKALLNRAFQDAAVESDLAWRRVKPFGKVDEPRIRFLTDTEAIRLVNACPIDLRQLVRAALLTGARFGELTGLQAKDVNLSTAQVYIAPAKSGRARHVPLNDEGVTLFENAAAGKIGDDLLFTKASGDRWAKNLHVRPLLHACNVAKIEPAVAFHELRHTYASHLAQAGVDLLTISKLLGHADTRITSKHYAHLAVKTLAAAVNKLPSVGLTEPAVVRPIR
jgi:integrase